MYYLNKIIGFIASPLGVAIAGLVIAVVCAWLKRVRLAKWFGGVTVVWLWLWMTPFMTRFVGAPLEREFLGARNTEEEARVVGEVVFNAEKQRGREAEDERRKDDTKNYFKIYTILHDLHG